MLEYRAFGGLEFVECQGPQPRAVVLQPKQAAVLTYLAAWPRGQIHSRDTLLAMFWPETDARHARAALRQNVHEIRRLLGEQVIHSVGRHGLRLDPEDLLYDLWIFDEALKAGDLERAISVRRGPFLDGFFLRDAPDFQRWLDDERARLDRAYCQALADLSESLAAAGELQRALEWAEQSAKQEPYSGSAVQRMMRLLELVGDRAGALRAADVYAARLHEDLGAEPEPELLALSQRMRTEPLLERTSMRSLVSGPPPPAPPAPEADGPAARRVDALATSNRQRPWRHAVAAGIALGLLTMSAIAVRTRPSPDGIALPTVLVLALANETGDVTLDLVGSSLAGLVSNSLAELGTVRVIPPGDAGARAAFVVTGSYYLRGDSLEFLTTILDEHRKRALPPPAPVRAPRNDPLTVAEETSRRVLAAVGYYTSLFGAPQQTERRPPTYSAYLAFNEGLRAMFRFDPDEAELAFRRAIDLDPTYTEAYILLAGFAFYNQPGPATRRGGLSGRFDAMDSLAGEIRRNVRPLTEADRLLLQWLDAAPRGDLDAAFAASVRLAELLPAANFGIGFRGVWANRPQAALDGLRRLNPDWGWIRDWPFYSVFLTAALHQLRDYNEELRMAQEGRRRFPRNGLILEADLRARVALGDIEAIGSMTTELSAPALLRLALELRAHGYTRESNRYLMQVVELSRLHPDNLNHRTWAARALLTLGRLEEAIPLLERLAEEDTLRVDFKGLLAIAYARRGDRVAAAELDQKLASVTDEYLHGLPTAWRARIAAQLGEPHAAVELLAQAFAEGVVHAPWNPLFGGNFWHTDPDLEPLRSYGAYANLVRPR